MNYSCYLLRNIYETHKTHTYNGSTNNLKRRIRQHNGEIMGGARQTSRASGGWEYYCIMCGFPDKINALQCEWRWKHPTGSSGKRTSKYSGVHGRINGLNLVLPVDMWTNNSTVSNSLSSFRLYIVHDVYHLLDVSNIPPNITIIVCDKINIDTIMMREDALTAAGTSEILATESQKNMNPS